MILKNLLGLAMVAGAMQAVAIDVDENANVSHATTTVLGINHIGLSVSNLDVMLDFYLKSTGFELLSRHKISHNPDADKLFGQENVALEVAVIKAPNMLLELIEFEHNENTDGARMPAKGPGMTHTCFQSPSSEPGWDKFMKAGASPLSRGGAPVDLGGYGVTYGYAYDPEGNMIELEQLDGAILERAGYDPAWQDLGLSMWMSQVALATPNLERLMGFYQKVLGFQPYRVAELKDNVRADEIADIDNLHLLGGWFKMNSTSKVMEFWQYVNPTTPETGEPRNVTGLGYTFSIEVADIQREYERLTKLGVAFTSAPVKLGEFWQVYANDVDGNVFALRQAIDSESALSVKKLDADT